MPAPQPPTPPAGPPAGACARCRRCCTLAPGQEGLVFPLSQEDVGRLDQALGHARWRARSPNSQEFLAMLAKLFPKSPAGLARAFPLGASHWRLAVAGDGRCFFLGQGGCGLTPEQRPAHCRLFPVWRLGNHILPLRVECLAIAEARDLRALLKSLDLDVALVKELFARIQGAWELAEEPGS